MDFYQVGTRETKGGIVEVFPDFTVGRSKDLMVRARSFYAIWDQEQGLWSTDEYDVQRLVDEELRKHAESLTAAGHVCHIKYLRSYESGSWKTFQSFTQNISDNSKQLDDRLVFSNTEVKKGDYVSRRLPYPLAPGDITAWDELIGTLYSIEERAKIEWTIGAIVSGDSKKIQKFLVFYGPAGTGKSTILNIIQKLFEGYTTTFEAKALGSTSNAFATEVFKANPLVAIQHDGDLSKIEDNTKLNSIISHEEMTMNEKYKPSYTARVNAFLLMGTNQPVKISDAKSGIIRRLIDVHPTGVKIPANHYNTLMSQIDFELGGIAHHCLEVYRKMGKNHYNGYRPLEMMLQTDVFFNYIEANYDIFKAQDGVSLRQAYALYKEYCQDTGIEKVLPQYKVREELRNYFADFKDRTEVDGELVRSYYSGFTAHPFKMPAKDANAFSLVMEETSSIFDVERAAYPAQYAKEDGTPDKPWSRVRSTLHDLDTTQLHYVKIPPNHIVIDFDLKDINGDKSLERNLEAASVWPATYAELSKSEAGVHLHYLYDGDTSELSNVYSEGIEVKVYTGNSSLRRKLSKCNNVPMSTINSGLPLKEKKMLSDKTIKSEKGLRDLLARNLRKEINPGTKTSVDFIKKILDDVHESGMVYDVSDLKSTIISFASGSTHQPLQALKVVQQIKWKSDEELTSQVVDAADERVAHFDLEVYPNLFAICWKFDGAPPETTVRMVNPSPAEIEPLFKLKLVGYNNRRYDNHILYAAFMGYNNQQLYELSQKIISGNIGVMFSEAYNISYADIFDFSSKKQSLKKFQIELGLHHKEMDLPWDEPVPDDRIEDVLDYCVNDVITQEETFHARKADFVARMILAELSGLTVNDTTQKHTAKIIFGNERRPQENFIYTDLSKEFPGYEYDFGTSTYRGETTGEGGYVYAEPGLYEDVALLDVASMHPTSIINLNLFGPYTPRFADLLNARLAIKHGDYESARTMLDGRLAPYLEDEGQAKDLSYALKIVINIVYGLTSAKFDNMFRDPRNKDNIVAKRGALFMIDLKHFVQDRGFTVAHIKTDSIKIPNATPEIIEEVMSFGEKYGYSFEHETTYSKFCLVNDAVYVAKTPGKGYGEEWTAVGAQFQHPYVFKTLFTHENVEFDDLCETKQVTQGSMYLSFDLVEKPMYEQHTMQFVGRTGRFVPVLPDCGGGVLLRVKDGKSYAVSGTKGYLWVEAEQLDSAPDRKMKIDMSYFERLATEAKKQIEKYGDFRDLIS